MVTRTKFAVDGVKRAVLSTYNSIREREELEEIDEEKMELSSLLLPSILLLSFLCSALILFFKREPPQKPTKSTVLKGYPIIGNLPLLIKNFRRIVYWVAELIPTSPTGTVTVDYIVFTANPSNVEHVTRTNFHNYPKGDSIMATFHDFLGRGILNAEGEDWIIQRKAASFDFNTKSLRAFVHDKVRRQTADILIPLLRRASRSGEVLDLQEVLERFAFDNVCKLVLDKDPKCLSRESEEGEEFYRAFLETSVLSVERTLTPFSLLWKLGKWLDFGRERRLRKSREIVLQFVEKCVKSRREQSGDGQGSDFLSRLVADRSLSDEFIRDIMISFVIAGGDTTPSALTWFFWILSSNPEAVEKIREEIKLVRSRQGDDESEVLTLDGLREMRYLHAAVSESMRLNPPAPLISRVCQQEDELPDGTRVRKGWWVMYSAYAMGRAEGIWGQDCGEFRPERWMEDGVFQPASPFRYSVFHAGPRMCLGKDMAYIQIKAVAASILEGFDVEVVEERGKLQLSTTMRMEGGLPVRVRGRK